MDEVRQCKICERVLAAPEFVAKWKSRCKGCYAAYMRMYRLSAKGREVGRLSHRNYKERHPDRVREGRRKYRKRNTERLRTYHREYARRWRREHPEERIKADARRKLRLAVELGFVKKLPCDVCGNVKVQAHHHDYSKPISVVWLCAQHHKEYHTSLSTAGVPSYEIQVVQ